MTARSAQAPGPAPTPGRQGGWAEASRRLGPHLDLVLGIAGAGSALVSLLGADRAAIDPRLQSPDLLAVLATAAGAGALAWRRTRPVTSYAVLLVAGVVVSVGGHYIGLLSVFLLLSLYSLAAHGRRRDALVGLGVGVLCFLVLALLNVPDLGTSDLLQSLALLLAAWALGDAIRSRRRQQRDQLEVAVAEERLRIARELHDVVAHSMSLIAVQAGVGAHVIRTDVDAAQRSLEVIADTSRQALEQTRSMLGLLREGTEAAGGSRTPTRSVGDVPALICDVRAAGLEVELLVPPELPELESVVSLTAYRIVQEGLTNVVKHSAAATATVTIDTTPRGLDIDVADPGPQRTSSTVRSGHGLAGLGERVALVGGSFTHGGDGAGFRLHTTLPRGPRR
ncbi:sensor histidine kinase [Kineococcus sp. SYSU DK001]|uniref:sensor histidine kinase n=1 Tax=Kineococcus sp. SYSU DK001 TaxID=3383122 RepID=UPI003D7CC095